MPQKRIPLRSCIACGQKRPKREMVRIVRTPEGVVEADPTGRKAGRGAYLCRQQGCWTQALQRRGRLEHALRGPVPTQDRERLLEYARTELQPVPVGDDV